MNPNVNDGLWDIMSGQCRFNCSTAGRLLMGGEAMVMRLGEVCGKSLFSAPFRGEPKTALNKVFLKKREREKWRYVPM